MSLKYLIRKLTLVLRVNIFTVAFSKVFGRHVTTDDKFCFGFIKKIYNFIEHSIIQYTVASCLKYVPYFPAHKTHWPIRCTVIFSLEILEKNHDKCILILVIYWKKTGLLHTKISSHNIMYSSQKPRKSSSLPLKSSSWLFSLNASLSSYKICMGIYKFQNNTYPRRIRHRLNLDHVFQETSASYGPGNVVLVSVYVNSR